MNKLAICFSGQGSQYVNMGLDYINSYKIYEDMASNASKILGFNVIDILKDENLIHQTKYTQPLIVLKSIFGYDLISKLNLSIDTLLGFSLGEYSAYYAANVFDFEAIFQIISKRATYMEIDAKKQEGMMMAVIGLDKKTVSDVCTTLQIQGIIGIANDNAPNQVVISGETKLIEKAAVILKDLGARRIIELKTSGAFHTSLMSDASKQLVFDIKNNHLLTPHQANYKIMMNLDASYLKDEDIIFHIKNQMTHQVRFRESILNMKKDGITHILEIGPGKVLTNLINKIDPEIDTCHFDHLDTYETVKGWLKTHGFTK